MKKLLPLVVAIVTLGSGFAQAELVPNPCNSENSSNPDCAISVYQDVYCPDPCAWLNDQMNIAGIAAMTACLNAKSSACAAATAALTAASIAAGTCEAANATAYGIKYAACELGSL